jgi:hypothetical protein
LDSIISIPEQKKPVTEVECSSFFQHDFSCSVCLNYLKDSFTLPFIAQNKSPKMAQNPKKDKAPDTIYGYDQDHITMLKKEKPWKKEYVSHPPWMYVEN